tara:strand:- start:474 stop:1772 length:1299 start_codon:yes stop_codon:yes gene_type:complete
MKNTNKYLVVIFILLCLLLRIFIGIQINFSHVDYEQIYLIGLEYAFNDNWSFWGPDVVWSKTRLPGAMQGILAGVPIQLFKHHYSPIILSNIISFAGLMLLAFYAKIRFEKLSIYFLIALFSLLPFTLFNGVVVLNTCYLIFSGAILFICVTELFSYRNNMLLNPLIYFFSMGFCLMFTYQLHLTWVMFFPFILVLFYLEGVKQRKLLFKLIMAFLIGCVLPSLTVLPTFIKYGSEIMNGSGGNLQLELLRIFDLFDLMIRFMGTATIDILQSLGFITLFSDSGLVGSTLLIFVKVIAIIQFIGICITLYFVEKTAEFKKTLLLFLLASLMSTILFMLSNKHLQIRTYILLFPIPIWLSLYCYSYLIRFKWSKKLLLIPIVTIFITLIGIGSSNFNNKYSFKSVEEKLNNSIENKDPYQFAKRRKTIMDRFN